MIEKEAARQSRGSHPFKNGSGSVRLVKTLRGRGAALYEKWNAKLGGNASLTDVLAYLDERCANPREELEHAFNVFLARARLLGLDEADAQNWSLFFQVQELRLSGEVKALEVRDALRRVRDGN